MKKSNQATVIALILNATLVASCGGGGSSNTSTSTQVPVATPVIVQLSGSGGDLSKYLGVWSSGCGITQAGILGGSNPTNQSGMNTYNFTSRNANVLSGTFNQTLYNGRTCSTPGTGGGSFSQVLQLTLDSQSPVTSSAPETAQGTADVFTVKDVGNGSTSKVAFGFLPGFGKVLISNSTTVFFTSGTLQYSKL